jgi:hypothetical protein
MTKRRGPFYAKDLITITEPGPKRAKSARREYRVSLGDLEVRDENIEHALVEWRKQAIKALSGPYRPALLFFRGYLGIIWRHPICEYEYCILDPQELVLMEGKVSMTRTFTTDPNFEASERRVRRHMADIIWDQHRDWTEELAAYLILNDEDRDFFRRQCWRAIRHKELKATGLTDNEIDTQLIREGLS